MKYLLNHLLDLEAALNGIVHGFAEQGTDHHLEASDGVAMFGVPIVTILWGDLDDGDTRIIHTAGEPGFDDGVPEFFDFGFVPRDGGGPVELEEIGVGGALEEKSDGVVGIQLLIFVTVVRAEEPKVACIIHLLDGHGAGMRCTACGDERAEEACLRLLDESLDLFDRVVGAEVLVVVFGLLLLDGVHGRGCFKGIAPRQTSGSRPMMPGRLEANPASPVLDCLTKLGLW